VLVLHPGGDATGRLAAHIRSNPRESSVAVLCYNPVSCI